MNGTLALILIMVVCFAAAHFLADFAGLLVVGGIIVGFFAMLSALSANNNRGGRG